MGVTGVQGNMSKFVECADTLLKEGVNRHSSVSKIKAYLVSCDNYELASIVERQGVEEEIKERRQKQQVSGECVEGEGEGEEEEEEWKRKLRRQRVEQIGTNQLGHCVV